MRESRAAHTCRDGRERRTLVSGRCRRIRPHLSEVNDGRASRRAEWRKLLPCVCLLNDSPSTFLWEVERGQSTSSLKGRGENKATR